MNYQVEFPKAIKRWDEALPLGNGTIGALIYGEAKDLRFSLDRNDIWDKTPPKNTDRRDFTYEKLIALAKDGNVNEIRNLFDSPYNTPLPTKLPSGKLIMHFKEGSKISSLLNLSDATGIVDIDEGEKTKIKLTAFCHAVKNIGVIRVTRPIEDFSFNLDIIQYGSKEEVQDSSYDPSKREIVQGSLKNLYYERAKIEKEKNLTYFTQKIQDDFSYSIVLGCKSTGIDTILVYKIATSDEGISYLEDAKKEVLESLNEGFEKLYESHNNWWQNYWNKSKLIVPDKEIEKQWYVTNYLFASTSRKGSNPMSLQGVWTADDGNLPPWKGDYHNDLNTQFSYTHFYKANHLDEGLSFIDYLWKLRDKGKAFAKSFYNTDGICMPGVMTIDGKPLGGWPMYSLSPIHQIWLCQSFINYYRYTGDKTFLREKGYPYLRESAICISSLLKKKEDGLYYLPISSSPEIHDDEKESFLTPNSNYDLSLLHYLFTTLSKLAKDYGTKEESEKWNEILTHLPPLSVNDKNVLMLSPDESLNESHRHLSNAMAIYPLELLSYDNEEDKKIIDATILDYERLGTGLWVGFSFPWMSHLYSIQENGEGAYTQLKIFTSSFLSPNGFHLNGDYKKRGYTTFHYRPFTLEANMLYASALQEMLFQMRDGVINLFPAIPEEWKDKKISFDRFLGENGLIVSARYEQHALQTLCLSAKNEMNVIIKGKNGNQTLLHLNKSESKYFSKDDLVDFA